MTISSETRKAGPFNGNGVTTSFPFVFKTFTKSDVKVIFTDEDEIETILVLDSDYTVTLNADQNANPGGSISYSTLATGEKLTVLGAVEYTQETDVQNQGGFYPEVIENAFDKITMLIQQVKEIADRAVVVPASSSVTSENYLDTINTYKLAAAGSAAASALSAIEASGYADAAEADKIQTGLDRIQTGLDVLAAEAAVVSALLKANNLSDLANVVTARANLGLVIGTDVQAFDANTVKKNVANTFTATQVPDNGTAAVSTTSTYTFDGADQIREVTLTNAITVTFGAPTGITEKAMYKFMLKAGDTSARVFAWNAAFKFPSATPPLTAGATTNGAYDIINFIGGAGNTLIYDGHHANVG